MATRIALTALAALYLYAAWGSGMDRMSADAPALERLVPAMLRAQADRSAAATALARGEDARALAFAAQAVRHDPVDPLADSLLGSARQYRGDVGGAEAAFRVAAQRGWRDRLTQLYWYDAAIQSGDVERAALRADALLRSDPDFALAGDLFAPLEASEAGRSALARRLAERPGWAGGFLTPGDQADVALLHHRAQIAQQAAAGRQALGCDLPRPLVATLLGRGMRSDAELVWQANCRNEGLQGGLSDGGFEQLAADRSASPFGWQKYARGDVLIEAVADGAGGHRLTLRNTASVSRLILSQALALGSGHYRLRADIRSGGQPALGRIVASLDCDGHARRPEGVSGDPAGSGQLLAVAACPQQLLGIWLRPGAGPVTIDNMIIERRD